MKSGKICVLLLLLSLLISVLSVTATAEEQSVLRIERQIIWSHKSDNFKYPKHRIPGIVVTKKDTVIIYCEARTGDTTYSFKDHNDWCMMDIYIQRSEDGGKTFGEPIYIAYGTKEHACVNNPVIMVGNDNTLHMLYCRSYGINGGDIWYRKSIDDGLTWTPERNLAEFVADTPHTRIAFGPTHGICTREGVLMTAVWMSEPAHAYVFYSEDNGETWKVSEPCADNTNETNIVQLSDGSILLNSRATPYRKVTTSPNGYSNWTTTRIDPQLPDPSCCAGMVTVDLEGLPYAVLFSNCATTEGRDNITLKCSFDDGITFSKQVVINDMQGGYSDVAVDSRGQIYVLYELDWGKRVGLARFSFFDAFCADEADAMTSTQTRFDLRGEGAMPLVSSQSGGDLRETDRGLLLSGEGKKQLCLDFSPVNQNINLSDYGAIAVKVASPLSGNGAIKARVQCGRMLSLPNSSVESALCVENGQEQIQIFDLDALDRRDGMLQALQLEYSPGEGTGGELILSEVAFFRTVEEAQAYAAKAPETSVEEPSDETKEQSGCGSSLSFTMFPLCIAILPVLSWNGKGGSKKRKSVVKGIDKPAKLRYNKSVHSI